MKKSVKEIIESRAFDYYINPSEVSFFIDNISKQRDIMKKIVAQTNDDYVISYEDLTSKGLAKPFEETSSRLQELSLQIENLDLKIEELEKAEEKRIVIRGLIKEKEKLLEEKSSLDKKIEQLYVLAQDSDSFATWRGSEKTKEILKSNSKSINRDKLILYYAMLAKKYLNSILLSEKGDFKGHDEICFGTGEVVLIDDSKISMQFHDSIEDLKSDLVETILIANKELQTKDKNRRLDISGTFVKRGFVSENIKERFSLKELKELAKSDMILSNINPDKIEEYISQGLLNKWNLIKLINKGTLDINIAIKMFEKGLINKEELLGKVFNSKDFSSLLKDKKLTSDSKLLLYSIGKVNIEELEDSINIDSIDEQISEKTLQNISRYYEENINKISELLTHNVLDFTKSMQFLDILTNSHIISKQDKEYLTDIMNDFKTKELLNSAKNGIIERETSVSSPIPPTMPRGVTIDPKLRREYLKSIGDIKDIFIKGQSIIQDDSSENKKNSLDGYQLIIIPDKKVAILEKFYEVTRNNSGDVEYKKDKNGMLIPAVENATYIMPIGMAKDFCEKKNKQELIKSPYVRRTSHTMNWVMNLESKAKVLNPKAEFKKENTKIWSEKIKDNYQELLENR